MTGARDERRMLRAIAGVRYGMKNDAGEYYCVPPVQTVHLITTPHAELASRWFNSLAMDDVLEWLQSRDPSWRVIRLLDYRWN